MIPKTLARLGAALALIVCLPSHPLLAQPAHGIAMYGEPALPPDFVSLPYANPDAPKGGRIIFGESGGFDSLNPFILKGNAPAGVSALTVETLLGRSYDEPFTLYGLLAESVETDAARSFVAFTLREEARFADGSPVTPEDVLWSFETLGTQGSPRYAAAWAKIAKAEKTGPRTVRFTFNTEDRELPLILGLRPILKKAQWDGKDFTVSSLEAIIGSGPYVIGPFEPGRFISYLRNPDWWGADLPFNRGLHNFDEVRYEYFGDGGVVFEAFKAGDITSYREANPAAWAGNYGFPAVQSGQVVLSEIPHQRPSGIEGFVFNTRREIFANWRVREALIQAFNFEFINRTLTGGVQPRITSYFSNSVLGMTPGAPAHGRERALLAPFADSLLPGALDGYALPVSDGSEANRTGIREATRLLQEAGWTVTDGVLTNAAGTPFAFDILLVQGQDDMLSIANIYVEALRRLGIAVTVTTVDSAQYKERTNRYDFDMTHYIRSLSLSPGNEQTLYWGAAGVTEPGTRNWMGMNSPAAGAMIKALLTATDPQEFTAATRALDRVLTSGRYVVPIWYSDVSRIAHARQLRYPDRLPIYGDWLGFQPDVWWYQD
ncbi:MAG: ABC transporter substrate-binding protein [Rhodobacter sp.]|nr:ABC transporter substrate-binding protein [Rhodobacter sp.]MCA3492636.1 ABC transporter substrate-binding protein [Rhodobacter sp.]MCA3499773.1 ABC transporter substrate-binding protein [Rhodobacter sp.]MCA3502191.1 ABC transporter substrate-binding protein [Rhodobacter sp.]MCA3518258.1 ABC transporter substrate-binding protein [Rhodobacter sp.]